MPNNDRIPDWVMWLPAVNATLNGVATVLLVRGWQWIRRGQRAAHKQTMLAAFGVSVAFLVCYLAYHFALQHFTGSGSKKFEGVGFIRPVYFMILISHIVLAGSFTRVVFPKKGDTLHADFGPLGAISVQYV